MLKTQRHFLPNLSVLMNRLPDPRREEQSVYSQAHLLWNGILLFMLHLGSRRQMRFERISDTFEANLKQLCGQFRLDSVADPDTLAYYAERADHRSVEGILADMTVRMIRMRALDPFRLYGYFPIAIDGSQACSFDARPWPGCPHRRRSDGSIMYFSYTLDAKLVTTNGMALSLASEMLTNEGNSQFDKQDCELKAFPRLLDKLAQAFPRTRICLLLDALYANQNIIRLIEARGWKYIITFKEGSMPERFAEAVSLARLQNDNALSIKQHDGSSATYRWVKQLPVAEFVPNVLFCREKKKDKKATNFVWLTNFELSKRNVVNITKKGGRLRWKIENEGYNVQKNNGYNMEHPYSEHQNGFKVFYVLLLIAHYLTQLILHGSLIRALADTFGSARNFARRLAESLRNYHMPETIQLPGQIRFHPT